jgi:hypothetical protein
MPDPTIRSFPRKRERNKQNRGQGFPEQQRITLHERLRRAVEEFLVGIAQVEDEFGQFAVALIRIGMHGFLQRAVDPGRNVAVFVQQRLVS